MKRGEAKFMQCDHITAVHWFDKRDVFAMSSSHSEEMVSVMTRSGTEPVSKPKLIDDYNTYMSGVDHCDQLLVYSALNRKTRNGGTVVFRLPDMSVVNAMILYTNIFPEKDRKRQCHKKFRMELAHPLVELLLNSYADPLRGSRVHQIFKGQLSSLSLGVKCSCGGSLFVSQIFLKYIFV